MKCHKEREKTRRRGIILYYCIFTFSLSPCLTHSLWWHIKNVYCVIFIIIFNKTILLFFFLVSFTIWWCLHVCVKLNIAHKKNTRTKSVANVWQQDYMIIYVCEKELFFYYFVVGFFRSTD